jgi:hypothetical protein
MLFSGFGKKTIDALSFTSEIRELCEVLNRKLEQSDERFSKTIASHPGGFSKELSRRRLSIAESYIRVIRELESDQYEERISALENLVKQSFHAKTIKLPLNTARVQINLIKEAIKSRNNRRRQLELVSDFGLASYGEEQVIRKLCKKFYLVEVPETGQPLKNLRMGWDYHVHDNLSEGRKTPTQVLLDAFIKGISEVVLAHYTLKDENIIREAYQAGQILGIKVQIGIEFSVGPKWNRRHFMYLPPYSGDVCDVIAFFKKHEGDLAFFIRGLNENGERRKQTVSKMLETFNQEHLPKFNEGYAPGNPQYCPPILWDDLRVIVLDGQASRIHLGELLFSKLKPVFFKRVLFEKAQYELAEYKHQKKELSALEFSIVHSRYEKIRQDYTALSPEGLRQKYIDGSTREDYDSFFRSEEEILPTLLATGGSIVYIHPLEGGLDKAVKTTLQYHPYITHVESFNMQDSFKRNPNDLRVFNAFIGLLNNGKIHDLKSALRDLDVQSFDDRFLEEVLSRYQERPLIPICGSDSTGRDPTIPGMGFISPERIPPKMRRYYEKTHYALPLPVSQLIRKYRDKDSPLPGTGNSTILSMGKTIEEYYNPVGDEEGLEKWGMARTWRYLNPFLKMILRVAVSFPIAYVTIGLGYALVWFGITFFRNILVDLISAKGSDPRDWSMRDVNFENTTQSLFWTGFSVPLLTLVKWKVEAFFVLIQLVNPALQQIIRFFVICFTNGTYIAIHNWLRGFNEKIVKANFFRSVFAWPPATLFSPLGDFLFVPSIVQAKFWSDSMAALIEGIGKSTRQLFLSKRDLLEVLPHLYSDDKKERTIAMLDILHIWSNRRKGKASLKQILDDRKKIIEGPPTIRNNCEDIPPAPLLQGSDYVKAMKELFLADGAFLYLTDFSIREFEGKNAFTINALVSTQYPRFCSWMNDFND